MTLREHLQAIRDGMNALPVEATYRANREARAHAIAALALLDDAHRVGETYYEGPYPSEWLEIHDPMRNEPVA